MQDGRTRALFTALAFLLVLIAAVGSSSVALDKTVAILAWGAFFIGSIIIVVKSVRSGKIEIYGQLGALPRRWQRWILDEHERRGAQPRPDAHDRQGS